MSEATNSADLQSFQQLWNEWVQLVEQVANRKIRPHRRDVREYQALHRELLSRCRQLHKTVAQPLKPKVRELEYLIRPFLSLPVLIRTDRELLSQLLIRCRQVGADLGMRSRSMRALLPLLKLVTIVLISWLALILILATGWGEEAARWLRVIWINIKRAGDVEKMAGVGILLCLLSLLVVSRSTQK